MWQTTAKLVGLCDNYRNIRVDQDKDQKGKGKGKDYHDIYKFKEFARKAMAFVDSKRLAVERMLAEAEAVRDEALAKAASLKSERKRLA